MKNLIVCLLLLLCSVATMEASSPPNQTVAVNDHQMIPQHQQDLLTPVVFEKNVFELPIILYLTEESAVSYTAVSALFNDMRSYYNKLEKSTYAPIKNLPKVDRGLNMSTYIMKLPPGLSGIGKKITYRSTYVNISPEDIS